MRYTVPLLLLLPLFAACEDALGPAGDCADEMRITRLTYGEPDSRPQDNDGTIFTETWNYFPQDDDPGRIVTFRWGANLKCQVTIGPAAAKIPSRDSNITR